MEKRDLWQKHFSDSGVYCDFFSHPLSLKSLWRWSFFFTTNHFSLYCKKRRRRRKFVKRQMAFGKIVAIAKENCVNNHKEILFRNISNSKKFKSNTYFHCTCVQLNSHTNYSFHLNSNSLLAPFPKQPNAFGLRLSQSILNVKDRHRLQSAA